MIKIIIILGLTSLIGQCSDGLSWERRNELGDLHKSYREIEQHLLDNVKSKDLEENMREAMRWLHEEASQGSDDKLEKALKLFTSMENMVMCTPESFDILEANDILTDRVASFNDQDKATRLTDIVTHYAKEHARECMPVYSKKLQEKYEQVGESIIQKVQTVAANVLYVMSSHGQYGKHALDAITILAENDPDKKCLGKVSDKQEGSTGINEVKLRELYDKYVTEPCKKFVAMTDDGWHDSFEFDRRFINVDPYDLLLKFENHFRICKYLIGKNCEELYNLFEAQVTLD